MIALSLVPFAPGFAQSAAVQTALLAGGAVAAASACVGVFTVLRGQSFAGHALADVSTTGGSGAFLVGASPFWGFAALGVAAAGVLELLGLRRPRGRDVATGIVLGAATGLAALFLYLGTVTGNTSGAPVQILFGSLFVISPSLVPVLLVLSLVCLAVVVGLYRMLLLSAVSAEIAAARGIPVRAVGLAYLLALALTVSLSAVTIGSVLSTALLIGPAATALRITRRPGLAMLWAAALGVLSVAAGTALAYDSVSWPPHGHVWPVSFFIVAIVFLLYLASGVPRAVRSRRVPA
ncbi:MAG: metal ABC transporter permease [Candidatus Dormibacteraceae bacterium]